MSTPPEAQLLDSHTDTDKPHTPTNITKYRQSLFARAKDAATKFLGKFLFGTTGTLTEVLPPVQTEPVTFRDEQFSGITGKIYWKDHYHM